jgi:hypothetical protein
MQIFHVPLFLKISAIGFQNSALSPMQKFSRSIQRTWYEAPNYTQ